MVSRKPVSNEVLLEKINQIRDLSKENKDNIAGVSRNMEQGFKSIYSILQEGYVTKSELARVDAQREKDKAELLAAISKRLHKDNFKPYAWVMNTIGGLGISGFVVLIGKMVTDYIRGGPPQ